jgi:hypothetical protein
MRVSDTGPDMQVGATDSGLLALERARSKEQYRWMERFIMQLDDRQLAAELAHAIAGKRAFQRFKAVLAGHPRRLGEWQSFRAVELARHIHAWLDAHHLAVPWHDPADRSARLHDERPTPSLTRFEEALNSLSADELENLLVVASFLFCKGRERDAQDDAGISAELSP